MEDKPNAPTQAPNTRLSQYRLFVSYDSKDKRDVEEIARILQDEGIHVEYDKKIDPGSDFTDEILKKIAFSHLFVVLLTEESHENNWVNQECGYARAKEIPILPLALVGSDSTKPQVPDMLLRSLQAIHVKKDKSDLTDKINTTVIAKLLSPTPSFPLSQHISTPWPEQRTEWISHYAEDLIRSGELGMIRQKAAFSSFHLPLHPRDPLWPKVNGVTRRSPYHRQLLSDERRTLGRHMSEQGCRLIVYPFMQKPYCHIDTALWRLRCLIRFLEERETEQVEVVISESVIAENVLIVGNRFVAQSTAPGRDGYRNTEILFHAPSVEEAIRQFDSEFESLANRTGRFVGAKAAAELRHRGTDIYGAIDWSCNTPTERIGEDGLGAKRTDSPPPATDNRRSHSDSKVLIIAAEEAAEIVDGIRKQLAGDAWIAPELQPTELPLPHEKAVLVFVLTASITANPAITAFAKLAARSRFPIVPVIHRPNGFDFSTLANTQLGFLSKLNAVAWEDDAPPGATLTTAVRRYLGLEAFPRDCRMFISYRRNDGEDAAQAIYQHFRGIGFDAFLDTKDDAIEPGEDFQSRIHEAISEKDFLLLVDSPEATDSRWIHEEVTVALHRHAAFLAVRVGGSDGFPQVRDLLSVEWGPDPSHSLLAIERAVDATLAARRSFDRRMLQTLDNLKATLPLEIQTLEPRQLLLTVGAEPDIYRCLMEYEDAHYDLGRLHRLALGHGKHATQLALESAILVHRGHPLSVEERDAVHWARGDTPLDVLSLEQVPRYFFSVSVATTDQAGS